jgi:Tfp pilus assembly protein PilN
MIQINLLPVKQARKREYGRQQLALFAFLIFVELFLLYLVWGSKSEELTTIEQAVAQAQAEVAQVQTVQQEITGLEAQLRQLEADRRVHENLQANRVGPGGPLQELKVILNRWTSERERLEQRERGWGDVDPHRVWLDSLTITPTTFRLRGMARDSSDLAEFLGRLETSAEGEDAFFLRPSYPVSSRTNDPYFGEVWQFSISGGMRYRPIEVGM